MTHGTYQSFIKGCLCQKCWQASERVAKVRSEWFVNRGNQNPRPLPPYKNFSKMAHGVRGSYVMGCRCEPCLEANRLYERGYRSRKRAS